MKEFTFTMKVPKYIQEHCSIHPEDFDKIAEQCAHVAEYVLFGWLSRKNNGAQYREKKQLELKREAEKLRERAMALEKEASEV